MTYQQIVDAWKKKIKSYDDMMSFLESYQVLYAYNSGKIENDNISYHDTREIFDKDGVVSYTGDLRTLYEMKNSKDAWIYLLDVLKEKRPLDEELLKHFQKLLSKNTYDENRWKAGERPGEYKKKDYVTGRNEVGTLPEWVHEEVSELLEELVELDSEKILTAAAYFHAKFENIHAFADANGRTGRLAMNYLLLLYGHPPVIVFEEDRKEYYEALEAWDERQSLRELVDFLKGEIVKTWEGRFSKGKKRKSGASLNDYI